MSENEWTLRLPEKNKKEKQYWIVIHSSSIKQYTFQKKKGAIKA